MRLIFSSTARTLLACAVALSATVAQAQATFKMTAIPDESPTELARKAGPLVKYLTPEYKKATGREPKKDHPEWRIAHRTLLAAGIPTVEGVGGDVAEVLGKRCTLQGFPWNWAAGDACYVRLVAMFDPSGKLRLETGRAA